MHTPQSPSGCYNDLHFDCVFRSDITEFLTPTIIVVQAQTVFASVFWKVAASAKSRHLHRVHGEGHASLPQCTPRLPSTVAGNSMNYHQRRNQYRRNTSADSTRLWDRV